MEKVANTNAVKSQVPAQKNERSAEKDAEFKAKKAAAAKAFAERQKQKKEESASSRMRGSTLYAPHTTRRPKGC